MATSHDQPFKKPVSFATASENPDISFIKDIAAEELVKLTDKVHIIDVRMPDEFVGELGHIRGAQLITLPTLPDTIDSLPKDETIVFVCKSGGRSAKATAFAQQSGFRYVYNMKGGMLRWNELSLPVELA